MPKYKYQLTSLFYVEGKKKNTTQTTYVLKVVLPRMLYDEPIQRSK